MKYTTLLIVVFLFSLDISAQSVAGVKFGSSYNTAISLLEKRYGEPDIKARDFIYYEYITIGGITWDFVNFDFVSDTIGKTYMNKVLLCGLETTFEKAEDTVMNLFNMLAKKYLIISLYREDKSPKMSPTMVYFIGGLGTIDYNKYLFSVTIRNEDMEKYTNKEFYKNSYRVCLLYGPVDYTNPIEDF